MSLVISMERIECSVWNNGSDGWGLRILGGAEVRARYFDRNCERVTLHLDDRESHPKVAKKSFWSRTCGELIQKEIGDFVRRHGLKTGDRVWLRPVEARTRFVVELH
jgi:hypothetical protein